MQTANCKLQTANCKLKGRHKACRVGSSAHPQRAHFAVCSLQFAVCSFFLVLFSPNPAAACNIPVYRYALENWPTDLYRATVLHRGPLAAEAQALVQRLNDRAASANLVVRVIDLSRPEGEDIPERFLKTDVSAGPILVLNYPVTTKIETDAWSGALTVEAIASLVDSPVRRELATRLHAGETVWLLLASGTKAADEAAAKLVEENRAAAPRSALLRVKRDDPAERVLVRMLLGTEPDLTGRDEPMAFPVFGRGRVLYALVGTGITADNVRQADSFLGGDCSCTVKRDNPGTDLLLTADWSDLRASGPPEGESQLTRETPAEVVEQPAAPPPNGVNWPRGALWVAVIFAGGLVVLTGALALRSRKRPAPHSGA
jgi:hypothetical protein